MNTWQECLIIAVVALYQVWWNGFACFRDVHFMSTCGIDREKFYILRKSKIWFLPIYAITRNWKNGAIRKVSFWGMLGLYAYFFLYTIITVVYHVVAKACMNSEIPVVFLVFVVILPVFVPAVIRAIVENIKNKQQN